MTKNKLKTFNDPIYGFIDIPSDIIFDIIEHPFFQRLRRIKQTGLSYLVYPGAEHTRFHHALGCLYLMQLAVVVLKRKGVEISSEEEQGLYISILLHDIGHGPFSHAMEHSIVEGVSHEEISLWFMESLNKEFKGELSLAIDIFKKKYPKKYLCQLVSSQLDIDRLDYLKRDSFYAGVSEGNINSERIISMLNVKNGELLLDYKGIYSVEEFLIARRLMYWQVYLHKTSVAAEQVLIRILKRVKELSLQGKDISMSEQLRFFVRKEYSKSFGEIELLNFSLLDDSDILYGIKNWQYHDDFVLSELSKMILHRSLPQVKITKNPIDGELFNKLRYKVKDYLKVKSSLPLITDEVLDYFIFRGKISNIAYKKDNEPIYIHTLNKQVIDVSKASDQTNIEALSEKVTKYYLCLPKSMN